MERTVKRRAGWKGGSRFEVGAGRSVGERAGSEERPGPDPLLWPGRVVEALEFRRAPLLAAAVWFALGEMMGRVWQPAAVLLIAVTVLAGLVVAGLRWGARIAVVPVGALWIAVGMWSAEVRPMPDTQAALRSYADGLSRTVRGRVERVRQLPPAVPVAGGDPDGTQRQEVQPAESGGSLSVDLRVDEVEEVTPDVSRMVPVQGGVRLTVPDGEAGLWGLRCGDEVEAPMILKVPERYRDPGAWQYADYLLEEGLSTHATVRGSRMQLVRREQASWRCRLYAAQSWASGRMLRYVRSGANQRLPRALRLNANDAGMLNAMLFGDRAGLNRTQRLGFERTGSFHLFVVSGMHVGLLAGMVLWLLRRVRAPEWAATVGTLAAAAGYALLTGFGAPVQRALWMTAVFLVARLLTRERSVLNALGAAALGVLVWSPGALFEASFQMTFLAIVAIGGIAVPLGEWSFLPWAKAAGQLDDVWLDSRLAPRIAQFRVLLRVWGEGFAEVLGAKAYGLPAALVRWGLWALELALIGVVAEMTMVLPMAVYFHRATVFALPTNMLTVPVIAVLVPLAVGTFVAALLGSWVALVPGAATALLLHAIAWVIGRVSSVQAADLRVPGPMWWVAMLAVGAFGWSCWAVRRSRGWAAAVAVVLPLVAVMVLWPERPVVTPGVLEVTAIDVGQGDSLLVVTPEGRTLLVDAGGPVGGARMQRMGGFDVGEEVVSPYLWTRRMRRLDAMVLTHAHSDHMGGMAAVMRSFRPRELWVGVDGTTVEFAALLEEAASLGVKVRHFRAGEDFGWGGLQVEVLSPEASYRNPGAPVNDDSLVLRLAMGKGSVLLEGDAERRSEAAMLASGRLRPVTLLKVGHHGSMTSSTPEFLRALTPQDAVVSVGRGNSFGHPRPEVVGRFAEADTWLYRTDEFGLTTFLLDREGGIREVLGAGD